MRGLTTVGGANLCRTQFLRPEVSWGQFRAFSRRPLQHADLMAQSQVLEFEGSPRAEDGTQGSEECREKNEHRRRGLRKKYKWLPLRHFEVFESHSPLADGRYGAPNGLPRTVV
jgi:hypothetical protein